MKENEKEKIVTKNCRIVRTQNGQTMLQLLL